MVRVGVIGCGYWGPNLIRNFVSCPQTELRWVCDMDKDRLEKVMKSYPGISATINCMNVIYDSDIDAISIATPVHTHYVLARKCLENGKHVLIEKPMASSIKQGKELVELAKKKNLQIMCDHTFCYTGAIRKIKEIILSGKLGNLLYFDSVRINLGLFQQDVNVVWDLAPHDLSILDFLIDKKPIFVSAHGICHLDNGLENIAYVVLKYDDNFIAHLHLNWLSPVKTRKIIIGGSEKMLVWDDNDVAEKIKIYDKGVSVFSSNIEEREKMLVSYRAGDVYIPKLDQTEALSLVVEEFASCIKEKRSSITGEKDGLDVLKLLEAIDRSIKNDGENVSVER